MATRGAAVATSAGVEATFDHPAALADQLKMECMVGSDARSYFVELGQARGHGRWRAVTPDDVVATTLGVALPLARGLGLGVVAHLPVSQAAQLSAYDDRRPHLPIWQSLGEGLMVVGSVGWRPHPRVALGAGLRLAADLDASGQLVWDPASTAVTAHNLDVTLGARWRPVASIALELGTAGRAMLRWRSSYDIGFTVPLSFSVRGLDPLGLRVVGVGLQMPSTWTLAWSRAVGTWGDLSASARYERWSEVRGFGAQFSGPGGQTMWRASPGARDTWSVMFGFGGERFRGGVSWRPTPLPKADGLSSWLDSHAVEISLGASWPLGDATWIDLALGWTHLWDRTAARNDPNHPIGTTSVSGGIAHFAVTLRHRPRSP